MLPSALACIRLSTKSKKNRTLKNIPVMIWSAANPNVTGNAAASPAVAASINMMFFTRFSENFRSSIYLVPCVFLFAAAVFLSSPDFFSYASYA